jgi:hypothetical protein
MTNLELADRVEAAPAKRVLRFSRADVAGKLGYRWQSIQTSDAGIASILCDMWNHRHEIAAALRAKDKPC